jgi:hypothetical protein
MTEPDLTWADAVLVRAAHAVPVPDPDSFASGVGDRLRARPPHPVALPGRPGGIVWRRASTVAAALIVVFAAVATLVAPVRSAVADLLGVDGVRITRAAPLPVTTAVPSTRPTSTAAPTATVPADPVAALHLGTPTTLAAAARLVGFTMRLPTTPGYSHPDAVLVGTPPAGGMVSMVYLADRIRPVVAGTGVAGLLSEFRGHLDAGFFQKLVGAGTSVDAVQVAGAAGFWLSGAPHEFFYVRPDGTVDTETLRLAANTLLWSAGGITYRFESALSKGAAVAIAVSMR